MFFEKNVVLLKQHAAIFKTKADESLSSIVATATGSLSAATENVSVQAKVVSDCTASAVSSAATAGKDVVGKVGTAVATADLGRSCIAQLVESKGIAVLCVVILRSNVPLKILDGGSKLPLVGFTGTVGKLCFPGCSQN